MARIPLSLVTGFLGSGKTTFLKHTARRLARRRVVYLVNEFSALDVDGLVLREIGPNVVSIPGGSIFCKCLVSEFILNLSEIPRRFGCHVPVDRAAEPGPCKVAGQAEQQASIPLSEMDGVIVEASGIANPKVVADMLRETRLDQVYDLASVVAVVDPGSFRKLLVTLPNIRAQIEAADVVLLNKIDLFSEQDVVATEVAIREIKVDVRIIRVTHGAAEVELFGETPRRDLHGEYAQCADQHYGRFSMAFYQPVDLARLRAALQDLGEDLYRAKGFVPTRLGMVYLDGSTAGLSIEACEQPDGVQAGLAMIVRADRQQRIERLIDEVNAGRFNA